MAGPLLAAGIADVPIITIQITLVGKMAFIQGLLTHFYCLNIGFLLLDLNKNKAPEKGRHPAKKLPDSHQSSHGPLFGVAAWLEQASD